MGNGGGKGAPRGSDPRRLQAKFEFILRGLAHPLRCTNEGTSKVLFSEYQAGEIFFYRYIILYLKILLLAV
jgi:hypothetical protein